MATAHNRKTRSDRLLWHALNCFKFKLQLQYREAEIDKKKDPRETKVDPKRPRNSKARSSLVIQIVNIIGGKIIKNTILSLNPEGL